MTARSGRVVRIAAPAKLNLYLHVTGRRADGYHELDSLMTFVTLHDTLEVSAAGALAMSVEGPFADMLESGDNLVLRAADVLARRLGRQPDVAFHLQKNIPVAAGLGGGSADAAAALRALCALWEVEPEACTNLPEIALGLGADVPVCLAGRAAFVGGIGEHLSPAPDLPTSPIVLVNPRVPVPTGKVFTARQGDFSEPDRFARAPDTAALAAVLETRRNDLEAPARTIAPQVGATLDALAATTGCRLARMSGSGATCFGVFDSESAAAKAARVIAAANPDWWVCETRLCHDGGAIDPDGLALG